MRPFLLQNIEFVHKVKRPNPSTAHMPGSKVVNCFNKGLEL